MGGFRLVGMNASFPALGERLPADGVACLGVVVPVFDEAATMAAGVKA
jgi:hypothetical protein